MSLSKTRSKNPCISMYIFLLSMLLSSSLWAQEQVVTVLMSVHDQAGNRMELVTREWEPQVIYLRYYEDDHYLLLDRPFTGDLSLGGTGLVPVRAWTLNLGRNQDPAEAWAVPGTFIVNTPGSGSPPSGPRPPGEEEEEEPPAAAAAPGTVF